MKASFQASVDSVIIGKKLSQLQPGEEVSYDLLAALVPGRDLRGKHRYILHTGMGLAIKDANVVTACVSGKGVKRLTDEEIVEQPVSAIARVRRTMKRATRKVLCSDYDKLDTAAKQKFNASMSIMGAILQFTSAKSINAINDRVERAVNRLPVEETVGLFLKNSK